MVDDRVFRVGDAEIIRIPDIELSSFEPAQLIPEWTTEAVPDRMLPADSLTADRRVRMSVHSWLVRDRGRTILIDTGAGNDKPRPYAKGFDHLQTPYLERLRQAGVTPEQVDLVLHTHLHVDHVGWNTRLRDGVWVPTFPNARYVFARAEHAFFTDPANMNAHNRTSFMVQQDSVAPVIAAGLAGMIEVDGREVVSGFSFHPTPGHSAAHASIVLHSAGEQALFSGDIMHHPVQLFRPDWNAVFDAEPDQARASRAWALQLAADQGMLLFTAHFADPAAGYVRRDGSGFQWRFA